jgi:hypothetical protein
MPYAAVAVNLFARDIDQHLGFRISIYQARFRQKKAKIKKLSSKGHG